MNSKTFKDVVDHAREIGLYQGEQSPLWACHTPHWVKFKKTVKVPSVNENAVYSAFSEGWFQGQSRPQ